MSPLPLPEVLIAAVAAWTGLAAGAAGTAALRARRLQALVPRPPPAAAGVVLLLRPCAGVEAGLLEQLTSGAAARCTLPVHHRLTVARAEDAALPVVQEAVARLRALGHAADWRICPPLGPNEKVSQLHGAVQAGVDGVAPAAVACVDSDVDLSGFDLDRLVGPLLVEPGLGACWAPPAETAPPRGSGDRASQAVLGGSLHAFVLLQGIDPAGLVGKCFAVRPDALEQAGAFLGLVSHLGEDMELSRRLRAAGWRVQPSGLPARSMAGGRSLRDTVDRFARWFRVIRAQRPALLPSYPLLFAPLPLQLAALAALAAAFPDRASITASLALAALSTAWGTSLAARRLLGHPVSPGTVLADPLRAQPVILAAWVGALLSRRLSWRGRALRIGPGGRLEAEPPASGPRATTAAARPPAPGATGAPPGASAPAP